MNLRPYSPTDWGRLCLIHDAARVHELEASGLAAAFLSIFAVKEPGIFGVMAPLSAGIPVVQA
jgi:hypothetical protein